jgi:hypothetical protein
VRNEVSNWGPSAPNCESAYVSEQSLLVLSIGHDNSGSLGRVNESHRFFGKLHVDEIESGL